MYTQIDILPELKARAELFVLNNDRELYWPFFKTLEKFCIENNVLVGGDIGLSLLIGQPVTKDTFFWDLYTENPYDIAKKLARELYQTKSPHIDPQYVAMKTELRHQEMTIMINTRRIIRIFALDRYRGLKMIELMGPAVRTSYFIKEKIKCIPEEMQLIEIYRALYSPDKVSRWAYFIRAEQQLSELVAGSLGEKAIQKVGGAGTSVPRQIVDKILIDKIISGSSNVLIGDYAVAKLGPELPQSPRVQFITETHIDDLVSGIDIYLRKQLPNLSTFKTTYIKYPLNIPTDFQITKHTIYINFGKEQTPIADVYNSSTFELIPFWVNEKIKIGNPWVLLRFRFIDLWILRLISNIDNEGAKFLKTKITVLLDSIADLRKLAIAQLNNDPLRLFQKDNYVGIYTNEVVAKKKFIKEVGEKFPIFYPAKESAEKKEELETTPADSAEK